MPEFVTKRWVRAAQVITICFCLLLLAMLHWVFALAGVTILPILLLMLYRSERSFQRKLYRYILHLTRSVRRSKQFAADQFPVGILIYDKDRKIAWHNQFMQHLTKRKVLIGASISDVFTGLSTEKQSRFTSGDQVFQVQHVPDDTVYYFREITEQLALQQKYEQEQTVLGYVYLDNFDEAIQGLSEQDEALLANELYSQVSSWALQYKLALKRYDEDKMFFVAREKELAQLVEAKFDILDKIRKITGKNKIPFTLSIGIASKGDTIVERSQNALAALNIALARGGDQAAIQAAERIVFFGGKTNAVEKRTRVRARVVSHAISNLLRDHKRVLIMGHRDPDLDALGAAIGMTKFAAIHECEAYVILNESNPSIDKLLTLIGEQKELKDLFISSEKAGQWVGNPDTLLVLVDTHKPSLVIDPILVKRSNKIIVIDHHRRGEEFVKDPVLVYIEPYASSTCELVTELLQYQDKAFTLKPLASSALLAGIVVDTKNFAYHAGARTFEAASFLRRHGADLFLVQSLLKEDLDRYLKRAELIKRTVLYYEGKIAIAMGKPDIKYDQLLIAQTADTLLGMEGVQASFVIGQRIDGLVSVSARSQGDINVQVVMEQMGGGGHFTNAAIQVEAQSLEEVEKQLRQILAQTMQRKGEKL